MEFADWPEMLTYLDEETSSRTHSDRRILVCTFDGATFRNVRAVQFPSYPGAQMAVANYIRATSSQDFMLYDGAVRQLPTDSEETFADGSNYRWEFGNLVTKQTGTYDYDKDTAVRRGDWLVQINHGWAVITDDVLRELVSPAPSIVVVLVPDPIEIPDDPSEVDDLDTREDR